MILLLFLYIFSIYHNFNICFQGLIKDIICYLLTNIILLSTVKFIIYQSKEAINKINLQQKIGCITYEHNF